jgi:hypothetical protein
MLSSVTHSAQALLSFQIQDQLKALFSQFGQQGATFYEQTLQVLREALNSGLSEIFIIALVVTILVFIINLFLKEIPLRKQHVLTEPINNGKDSD